MDNRKFLDKYNNLQAATLRLSSLANSKNKEEYYADALIQRFEFTFELMWKTLKEYLEYKGINILSTPRDVFRKSFEVGIITEAEVYEQMLSDRNMMSHIYDENTSKKIYLNILDKYIKKIEETTKKIGDLN